jgi:hypothetical protein
MQRVAAPNCQVERPVRRKTRSHVGSERLAWRLQTVRRMQSQHQKNYIFALVLACCLTPATMVRAADEEVALTAEDIELTVEYHDGDGWVELSKTDQDSHLNIARCECGESLRMGAKLLDTGLAKVRVDPDEPVIEGTLYYGRNCNDLQARDDCEELGSKEIGGGKAIDESVAISRLFSTHTAADQPCEIGKNVSSALWLVLQKDGTELSVSSSRSLRINGKVPAKPVIKKAVPGNELVELQWDESDSEDLGYQVLCSGGEHPTVEPGFVSCSDTIDESELCTARVENNQITIKGLTNSVPYALRLLAIDEAGNVSAPSATVSASPEASLGFAELYDESGGAEGGCSMVGPTRSGQGTGALVLALLLLGGARFFLRWRKRNTSRFAVSAAIGVGLLLLHPAVSRAQLDLTRGAVDDLPAVRAWRFTIGVGWYRPSVDDAFATLPAKDRPFGKLFGNERKILPTLELQRTFFDRAGVFSTGVSIGYQNRTASALSVTGKTATADETNFMTIPVSWSVMWLGDFSAHDAPFPLVPYLRAGLDAFSYNSDGPNKKMAGVTFGYHYGAGLELSLSKLDPTAARAMAADSGIAEAALYAEIARYQVDDFGAGTAMDLSDTQFSMGLMVGF